MSSNNNFLKKFNKEKIQAKLGINEGSINIKTY